ncbi:MAG: DUF4912 domain-containing protein [Candidatus Coatesbacteria bacterium]
MAAGKKAPFPLPPVEAWSLPDSYGDTRIVAMVRDPWWIYAYWEIQPAKIDEVRRKVGDGAWRTVRSVLRVHDVTGVTFDGTNARRFHDITIEGGASAWYVEVGVPGRSWCVEIGILTADGRFFVLARSNVVTTPRDTVSPVIDEEWMVQDEVFQKLAGVAGTLRPGASTNLAELMRKRMIARMSSEGLTSLTSPVRRAAGSKQP